MRQALMEHSGLVWAVCVFMVLACSLAGCGKPSPTSVRNDFFWQCEKGRANRVENMLKSSPGLANVRDEAGATPLHVAAAYRRVEVARVLIKHGANINALDPASETALHVAAAGGDLEMARCLIDAGIDVNLPRNGVTALHQAILMDRLEMVKLLVSAGADVNASGDKHGQLTPLLCAGGKKEITVFLRKSGARR